MENRVLRKFNVEKIFFSVIPVNGNDIELKMLRYYEDDGMIDC